MATSLGPYGAVEDLDDLSGDDPIVHQRSSFPHELSSSPHTETELQADVPNLRVRFGDFGLVALPLCDVSREVVSRD